jgi:protein phosphatase
MITFWKRLFSRRSSPPPTVEQAVEEIPGSETEPTNSDLRAIVVSDLGCVRANNEDAGRFVRISEAETRRAKGHLVLVADGMGGHAAGEVASQLAVETISRAYYEDADADIARSLGRAVALANQRVFAEAQRHTERRGMGTTCTAVVVQERRIYYAHVGDSRFYHLAGQTLHQITHDHTVVQEMVRQGTLSPGEAEHHPNRNVLTNALGTKPNVQIDTGQSPYAFGPDDRLLVCSDGLYDVLTPAELVAGLTQPLLRDAAYQLVETAKARGGPDNITVALVEWQAVAETAVKATEDVMVGGKGERKMEKGVS